ncbi:SRPBCC family protein [Euzebya sp.]|uniref:SRPBCC family protein n=1 Tax=Euzebya sp. TaxID=1971409 RepID=UPI0035169E8F
MTPQTTATTVRHDIVVDAPIDRAFRVFVERFDAIKPREHNLLAVDIAESVLEPREDGRVYDRGVDGSECAWGRVLAYEPPDRLVFTWDISPRWQLETDLAKASEVEVRFVAESPDRTRVELEHRHLDRHGDGWTDLADGVRDTEGWPLYLERFRSAAVRA